MDFWIVPVQKITGTIQEKVYQPAFVSEYPDGKGNTFTRRIGPTHMIKVKLPLDNEPTAGIIIEQEVYDAIKALALTVGIHFIIMYLLVFVPVNAWVDIKWLNLRNLYKAMIMVAPMVILMLYFMQHMFENKKLNSFLYTISFIIIVLTFIFIRQQTFVGNRQFIESMIPHHSSAITMCPTLLTQNLDNFALK